MKVQELIDYLLTIKDKDKLVVCYLHGVGSSCIQSASEELEEVELRNFK